MTPDVGAIRYLTGADVVLAAEHVDVVAVIQDALADHALGRSILPHEAYLGWPAGDGTACRSLNMPAFVLGSAGTKIINANPANVRRELPRASGVILLFARDTGAVVAILAAARISALRTAAVTAVAARSLACRPVGRVALIGAGALAAAHVEVLSAQDLGISEICVYDVAAGRAARLRDDARSGPVPVTLARDARTAIRGARLVVPVTTADEGYIARDWLAPGTLLVNVSLDDPLPAVVLEADLLIVDDWSAVAHDRRRLLGRLHGEGVLDGPAAVQRDGVRRVDAELGDVLLGRHPGRAGPDDIVVVNPFGLALEDVAVATAVHRAALGRGIGHDLPR